MRLTRKAELISCVLGHSPGSHTFQGGLLLDLELKEQQLASSLSETCPAAHVLNSMLYFQRQAARWAIHYDVVTLIGQELGHTTACSCS
jgi:hypothetical protein